MNFRKITSIVLVFCLIIFSKNTTFAKGSFEKNLKEYRSEMKNNEKDEKLKESEEAKPFDLISTIVVIIIMVVISWVFSYISTSDKVEDLADKTEAILSDSVDYSLAN